MGIERKKLTVADLKAQLDDLPDDAELIFEGGLTFDRIHTRGQNLEQVEFKERFMVLDD